MVKTFKSVSYCYTNQNMCDKTVDNYVHASEFVPNAIRLKKCAIKPLIPVLFYFILFLIDIKLQKYVIKVVSKEPFMLKYCLDKYKTQEMCDKAVDAFLPALKFVPDWFVTKKIISDVGLNSTNFNNKEHHHHHDKFDDYDPETINHIRLMA